MISDPITEEIREIRHRLATQFDNDITLIGEDIRRRQRESGRKYRPVPTDKNDESVGAASPSAAIG